MSIKKYGSIFPCISFKEEQNDTYLALETYLEELFKDTKCEDLFYVTFPGSKRMKKMTCRIHVKEDLKNLQEEFTAIEKQVVLL
jgi:hypothetical protein